MSEQTLNQVLAIEKGAKGRAESMIKIGHQQGVHVDLFKGMARTYTPFQDDGVDYPPEAKNVQLKTKDILAEARGILSDLWDTTATKDFANCNAKADIIVNGETVASGVPATYLLFMEKQIMNLRALVARMPVLDAAVQWTWDEQAQMFRSEAQKVHKTKKVQKPLVLLEPTKEHPGKAEIIVEDVPVGTYETRQLSACIPEKQKKDLDLRLVALSGAVKQARERANMVPAPQKRVAVKLFEYIFRD